MSDTGNFTFEDIHSLARGFQESRVFLTAFELDIFTVIGNNEMSSAEIAGKIKADSRATDRLLNALCVTGAIKKENNKFRNSKAAEQLLVKGKPDYQAGIMHTVHLWESWSMLTDAVLKGRHVKEKPFEERDDNWYEPFIAAMHNRAVKEAPGLVDQIDTAGIKNVLDVGGGSGAYSIAFVKKNDQLTATVFDLPNVVPLTEKYLRDEGVEGRVTTAPGDYNTDELPSGFDLVFLSAIIHSNSPEINISLFKKAGRALNPGGRIVISDFIMNDDRISPVFGTFFSLNMLVNTDSGDTYTESEIKDWMTKAGLTFVERKETRNTGLMVGRKN